MRTCETCQSTLPEEATFCGTCGGIQHHATRNMPLPAHLAGADPAVTMAISQSSLQNLNEEDEERKKRAALLGLAAPLVAGAALLPDAPTTPFVQGTPNINNAPAIQGTPQIGNFPPDGHPAGMSGNNFGPMRATPQPAIRAPHIPQRPSSLPRLSSPPPRFGRPGTGTGTSGSSGSGTGTSGSPGSGTGVPAPHGCLAWLLVIMIPLLILASIFGAGITIFAPSLTLNGDSVVTPGGTLHLNGHSFLPGNAVSISLDDNQPIYFSHQAPAQPSLAHSSQAGRTLALGLTGAQLATGNNTITVGGDGSFHIDIPISADWRLGQHTIHASEGFSPRNATLTFEIVSSAPQTPTPTATSTPTPTATPTVTPVASATDTTTSGLSAILPNNITLAPITAGAANQSASAQATLSTTGTSNILWNAKWDQNQASWLQVSPSSGQLQAPGTQTITVSEQNKNLQAGTYHATVTFTSTPGTQTITLNITLTVQSGCLNATPNSLTFTAIEGGNDPQSQKVQLTNCGSGGTWSATSNANWLNVSPTGGTLSNGGQQNVAIAAFVANNQLKAGNYQGTIQFSSGSSQTTVNVTLTVQAAPTISVNQTSFSAYKYCKYTAQTTTSFYLCSVTITNNSSQVPLDWSTTNVSPGVVITPSSGTLQPGQTLTVMIGTPRIPCNTPVQLTFVGPANQVQLTINC